MCLHGLPKIGGRSHAYQTLQVLPTDPDMAAAAAVAGVEVVRLRLPEGVAAGLLHVEVQQGALCAVRCPPAHLVSATGFGSERRSAAGLGCSHPVNLRCNQQSRLQSPRFHCFW